MNEHMRAEGFKVLLEISTKLQNENIEKENRKYAHELFKRIEKGECKPIIYIAFCIFIPNF